MLASLFPRIGAGCTCAKRKCACLASDTPPNDKVSAMPWRFFDGWTFWYSGRVILHIASLGDWQQAQAQGRYLCASLDTEGFIHCSTRGQVLRVANLRFQERQDLLLLCIDPEKVTPDIKHETPAEENTDEVFPHIYGPLNLDAVTKVLPFQPTPQGIFELPRELDL